MEYVICSIVGMAIVVFLIFVRVKNTTRVVKQEKYDQEAQNIKTANEIKEIQEKNAN